MVNGRSWSTLLLNGIEMVAEIVEFSTDYPVILLRYAFYLLKK